MQRTGLTKASPYYNERMLIFDIVEEFDFEIFSVDYHPKGLSPKEYLSVTLMPKVGITREYLKCDLQLPFNADYLKGCLERIRKGNG